MEKWCGCGQHLVGTGVYACSRKPESISDGSTGVVRQVAENPSRASQAPKAAPVPLRHVCMEPTLMEGSYRTFILIVGFLLGFLLRSCGCDC